MANYFQTNRDVELSTIYYIETQIDDNWSEVEVIKGFPEIGADRATSLPSRPIVSVRLSSQDSDRFELGNTRLRNEYLITIDIFARSDGQRLDLAGFLLDKIKDPWTYYEHAHASGDPESLDRTADGKIRVDRFISNAKVDIFDSPEKFDKFRHILSFVVVRSSLQ